MSRTDHNRGGQWCAAQRWLASQILIEQVPVASLRRGDSPRLDSSSKDHKSEPHEAAEARPIIVRRSTMQIIDGDRRVDAALQRHQDTIAVQYFDGTSDECYVLAVLANTISHGLQLSLTERKAAATRILGKYPEWSNRMIGSITGLSHHTVNKRRRLLSTGQIAQLKDRLGMDGKTRPAARSDQGRSASKPVPTDRSASAQGNSRHADDSGDVVGGVQARSGRKVEPLAPNTCGAISDSCAARGYVALKRLGPILLCAPTKDGH